MPGNAGFFFHFPPPQKGGGRVFWPGFPAGIKNGYLSKKLYIFTKYDGLYNVTDGYFSENPVNQIKEEPQV